MLRARAAATRLADRRATAAGQGTHISKPRSCDIDDWTEEHLEAMRVVGNTNAEAYWCYNIPFVRRLPLRPAPQSRLQRGALMAGAGQAGGDGPPRRPGGLDSQQVRPEGIPQAPRRQQRPRRPRYTPSPPSLLLLFPTLHISPSLFTVTASCSVTCGRAVKSKADELCGWSGVEAYEKTGWMDKSGGAKSGVQSA